MAEKKLDPPTKEDYLNWRSTYVTKFFIQEIFNKRELLKEAIADGVTSGFDELNLTIGRTQSIKDIIDYVIRDFEYIDIEPKEDKNE